MLNIEWIPLNSLIGTYQTNLLAAGERITQLEPYVRVICRDVSQTDVGIPNAGLDLFDDDTHTGITINSIGLQPGSLYCRTENVSITLIEPAVIKRLDHETTGHHTVPWSTEEAHLPQRDQRR